MKTQTLVTALGRDPHRDGGSVNPPVHHTSTLVFDNIAAMRSYEAGHSDHKGYGRHGTPTHSALEDAIATLEGADYCAITSSGLSATVLALLAYVGAGDHLLLPDCLYASTRKFADYELTRLGVEVEYYDPTIGADIEKHMRPNTKAVYTEFPGSLTFEMQDIPAIAKVAHAHDAIVISDSTWATPFFQRPFDLGVDVSIQSVTKYIAGHSDLVMGAVSVKEAHKAALKRAHLNLGLTAGAGNVFLAMRGLRSAYVRLKHQEKAAMEIALWLEQHPKVKRVLYPALPSHAGHALWKRDLTGAASVFGFELKKPSESAVAAFVDALHHFSLGYSWGGYESLVTAYQPATMRTATRWAKEDWIIRLNIGLEDTEDLISDLSGAFDKS